MRDVGDSEPTWISWDEAARLTGIRTPTIEHAVRVGRIVRRAARGTLPTLDRDSVLAWAVWHREQVAQRAARRREREGASSAAHRTSRPSLNRRDDSLGPPREGTWLSVPAAATRLGVTPSTTRRWLTDGRLDGVQRAERWVTESSVDRVVAQRRTDADEWVSLAVAARIAGCSTKKIAQLVEEHIVVQRPGPRCLASINRDSALEARGVLATRREIAHEQRDARQALLRRHSAPEDGTVWLSVETTALLLGLSHSGVTLRIRTGKMPATQRGRRWWVRREDAERLAAAAAFEQRERSASL